MPRRKRVEQDEEVYELSPEELFVEKRLEESEKNILSQVEAMLINPSIKASELLHCANTIGKLRSEARARYKLHGRFMLGSKQMKSATPEETQEAVLGYLLSLAVLDRVQIYRRVRPEESLAVWVASLEREGRISLLRGVKKILERTDEPETDIITSEGVVMETEVVPPGGYPE